MDTREIKFPNRKPLIKQDTAICLLFIAMGLLGWVLMFAKCSHAETVKFTWTAAEGVTGYEILQDRGNHVVFIVRDPDQTTASVNVPDDGTCHTFSIRSVKDDARSELGNMVAVCPAVTTPVINLPSEFTVHVE